MLPIFQLVPFIMAPFLFSELAPSLKLLAFFILFLLLMVYLTRSIIYKHDLALPELPSYWLYFSIACLLLYFGIFNTGYLHQNWPIILGGMFFILTAHYQGKVFELGVLISIFFSWLFLLLIPISNNLLKDQFFHSTIVPKLAPLTAESQELLNNSLFLSRSIIAPDSMGFELLFHFCTVLTTSYLFYLAYSKSNPIPAFVRMFVLFLWSILLVFLVGKTAFILLAIYITVFMVLCTPHMLLNYKNIVSLSSLIIFFVFCYLLNLELFIQRSNHVEPYLAYFDISMAPMQLVGILAEGFNQLTYFTVYTEAIALSMTAYCFYRAYHLMQMDLLNPAALAFSASSILILLMATISDNNLPNFLTLMLHPLFWIALVVLLEPDRPLEEDKVFSFYYLPHTVAGLFVILALIGGYYFLKDWRAQVYLEQYANANTQEEELRFANQAYQWEAYRGDSASVFLTEYLQELLSNNQLPQDDEIRRIDAAFYISARSNYIPVEAYKLLSDLYLQHDQRDNSVQILRVASSRYPEILILHEFLGDRLRQLGLKRDAIEAYKVCTNIDPASPRLYKKLSTLYLELGENQQYERARDALITLDPSYQFN